MSHPKSKNANDETTLRIVTQHREKNGMVYEMKCNGAELDIRICPLGTPEDREEWQIEARPGRANDAARIAESATTRRDALAKVAHTWAQTGLPLFDWDAVARALTTVRAL